jgi:hypothetical protein
VPARTTGQPATDNSIVARLPGAVDDGSGEAAVDAQPSGAPTPPPPPGEGG